MIERQYLKDMSTWAGFVGIMTIISGAISAVFGLFAFIIGAVPGIITIILGIKLRAAKNYADELLAASDTNATTAKLNLLIMNLNTYFKIQGILLIIALVLGVIGFIMSLVAGASLMNSF